VGGVDHHHVHAGFPQGGHTIEGVGGRADGGAHAQPAAFILAGAREFPRLLDVLDRDHPGQLLSVIDDEHLLDTVLVQQSQHLFLGRCLAHGDQALLGGHDRGDRRVELLFEAQIAVCDDAHDLLAEHDRNAGDAPRVRQVEDFADGHGRRHRDRILDQAALEFLYAPHLARLSLDAHALVNDTDAAFLGDGDRQPRLGDGVHGGREQRHVQADAPGQLRGEVHLAGQNLGIGGHEQDVVERQSFFEDSHS